MDVDATARRSVGRVLDRLDENAPCRDGDAVVCPFCDSELTLRRSILGTLDEAPSGERPHIDGVHLKCAGDDGCAFNACFDVPLVEDHGYWPELSHEAEFERERELRDGERVLDRGYTPDDAPGEGDHIQGRLEALGYL